MSGEPVGLERSMVEGPSAHDQAAGGLGGLVRSFLRHRVAANLLAVVLAIAGLVALTRLNTQFFPTTEIPTITVSIAWPGASAQEISQSILDLVEPEVRFIEGIDKVTSYAVEGSVRIVLEFNERADMQKALSDVESRMSTITTLPQEAERPVITRAQLFETVGLVLISGQMSEGALQEQAKALRDRLLEAKIDRVTLSGKRDQEIWAEIPSSALRQLNLTARDVADRIAVVSQDTPLGTLEGGTERQLRARGRQTTATGVASIELRAFESGQKILVRDVAVVREAFDETAARHFQEGQPAIILNVQRAASGDTLRSMRLMMDTVDAFRRSVPGTVKVETYDIRAKVVDQRIRMLTENAIQGFTIVVLVLLLFLNARVAFWVAMGVPVALLATFALMLFSGQTINAVSLVALILVLGIIVDDAIVVGEEAVTRHQAGASPMAAAEGAATRMLLPVLASTLTTQAAFFPILLITGVIGQILSAIPFVVIVALAASLVECFLVLPTHLKHSLEGTEARRGRVGWFGRIGGRLRAGFDRAFDRFRDGPYRGLVGLAYRWRYVTLALGIAGLIAAMGLISGGRVAFTFFPVPEPETVFANITFAPGLPEVRMVEALKQIEASVRATDRRLVGPEGKSVVLTINTTLGQQDSTRGQNLARIEVELTPGEEREVRTRSFVAAWNRAIPQIAGIDRVSVLGRRGGPPGFDVDVRLTGASLDQLKTAAIELRSAMEGFSGLIGLDDDLPFGKADVILELTPRGQALGFTTDLVARQVRSAYQGAVSVRFARGDEEVTVRVRASARERAEGLAGLLDVNLRSPGGANVRLSEVVRLVESQAFSVIRRFEGKVAVSVTANVDSNITTADQVLTALRAGPLPQIEAKYGIRATFEGRAETQRRTFADLRTGAIIALALIYLILVFVLQRWLQPLVIMTIIPFGFTGMVLGHYAMGFQTALFSMIGLLGLSGIVVNGSIVMIDRMNERRESGEEIGSAVVGASCDRLRAILLTALTTIGGMSPLLFEKSLQAQFLIPIAITLSFGLAYATLLQLFLVPAVVGIGEDIVRLTQAFVRFLVRGPQSPHRQSVG